MRGVVRATLAQVWWHDTTRNRLVTVALTLSADG